jgi:microcystin-dependent protein
MSTSLTTAAQVANVYGGTWEAWGAGRVPVGVDPNDADFNASNKTGGSKTVTLQLSQIPKHRHSLFSVDTTGGSQGRRNGTYYQGGWWGNYEDTTEAGGGGAHNNLQPYVAIYMWRRTA